MHLAFLDFPPENLTQKIFRLEGEFPPSGHLYPDKVDLTLFEFVQLCAVYKNWNTVAEQHSFYQKSIEKLLTTSYHLQRSLCFLCLSDPKSVGFYFGCDGALPCLDMIWSAHFPGISINPESAKKIAKSLQSLPEGKKIVGDPHAPSQPASSEILLHSLDILWRGLFEKDWAYLVQCTPCSQAEGHASLSKIYQEIENVEQKFPKDRTYKESELATYYLKLLHCASDRLCLGMHNGLWLTAAYFFAPTPDIVEQGVALLYSILSGPDAQPQRMRVTDMEGGLSNCLNTQDLTRLIQLPFHEIEGFEIKGNAQFDTVTSTASNSPLPVGHVYRGRQLSNHVFSLALKDLQKHTFIAGITGSGKTSTNLQILSELWLRHHIPFLVIEPAKFEYRNLLSHPGFQELQVFTLSDENTAPFRINPFEFSPGTLPQTHVDYLKALFLASFHFVSPTPYVLEECLIRIYQDRGWDFASGSNARGYGETAFPTLSDLYYKINEVTKELGYDAEITQNIAASLRTRIQGLRLGGKGLMLDTRQSLDFEQICGRPIILELHRIGNDQEKAFLIGLILIKLYEHCESSYNRVPNKSQFNSLLHLLVIEEAHRLLKSPEPAGSSESGNAALQVVAVFTNMLAELRSFGEGFLIIEQIPSKLAPEVIKNTNTKFLHRMIAKDDKQLVGATMNLTQEQERFVTSLLPGDAVSFREGMDNPILIKVLDAQNNLALSPVPDEKIQAHFQSSFYPKNKNFYLSHRLCLLCENLKKCTRSYKFRHGNREKTLGGLLAGLSLEYLLYEAVQNKFFSEKIYRTLSGIFFDQRPFLQDHSSVPISQQMYCLLLHALENLLEQKGSRYQIDFLKLQEIHARMIGITKKFLSSITLVPGSDPVSFEIQPEDGKLLQNFQYLYKQHFSSVFRFASCHFCEMPCLLWEDVVAYLESYPEPDQSFLIDSLQDCAQQVPDQFLTLLGIFLDSLLPASVDPKRVKSLTTCILHALLARQKDRLSENKKNSIIKNVFDAIFPKT